MDTLRYFRRHPDVRKARLVVLRWSGTARNNFGNSRPCIHCISRILRFHRNITSIVFFENGHWYDETPHEIFLQSGLSSAEQRLISNSRSDHV